MYDLLMSRQSSGTSCRRTRSVRDTGTRFRFWLLSFVSSTRGVARATEEGTEGEPKGESEGGTEGESKREPEGGTEEGVSDRTTLFLSGHGPTGSTRTGRDPKVPHVSVESWIDRVVSRQGD